MLIKGEIDVIKVLLALCGHEGAFDVACYGLQDMVPSVMLPDVVLACTY